MLLLSIGVAFDFLKIFSKILVFRSGWIQGEGTCAVSKVWLSVFFLSFSVDIGSFFFFLNYLSLPVFSSLSLYIYFLFFSSDRVSL